MSTCRAARSWPAQECGKIGFADTRRRRRQPIQERFGRARLGYPSILLIISIGSTSIAADPIPARPQFNRDVRPILSNHCFACHGPDENKREAELRMDTHSGLLGDSDPSTTGKGVVVPRDLGASELWQRITSTDVDQQMPPTEFAKPLSAAQRTVIRRWIEQGAEWEGHWAFNPIRSPSVPTMETTDGVGNQVDAFITRALARRSLQPSPIADRRTLIRRLSFDLTGLPPAVEDVERFVRDERPDAYERLVDRLLKSPHYGERMAMWWLDLVRYADSVGYHGDQPVSVSPFRDYVIESFNTNKPFDQFTIEQLGGDLIREAGRVERIASGYNRLGMMSAEGGVQPKEYLAKYAAERVRNLGGTWLGITLGCAECHDHKYDPFTMREFYSLESFFADIQERGLYSGANVNGRWGPQIPVPTPEEQQQLAELDQRIERLQQKLKTSTPALQQAQAEWESQLTVWQELKPETVRSKQGATLTIAADGSILASGKQPAQDSYQLRFDRVPEGVTAIRLEVLPHKSLPKQGPGRASNGNFVLTEFTASRLKTPAAQPAAPTDQPNSDTPGKPANEPTSQAERLKFTNATASYEQTGAAKSHPFGKWAILAAIDADERGASWGWAVMEQVGQPHSAVFELASDLDLAAGESLQLTLDQQHTNAGHTLGHFRISVATAQRPVTIAAVPPAEAAAVLRIPAEQRSDAQNEQLAAYYRSIAPMLEPQRKRLAEITKQRTDLNNRIRTTLVTVAVKPRMIRVLPRGNWMDDTGDIVQPRTPAVLPPPKVEGRRLNRLDLAEWIVDESNPLTARVVANRVWALFFAAGLSSKLDDLGSQGEWPSHPELLDYLASDLRDSGWDFKRLVKTIVMSRTYRQQSRLRPESQELDPYNRWLSRQSRFRLDAEMVRDNALSVSGLLINVVGGQSVKPYQPAGYWAYLNFPARRWKNGTGADLYRRGLYTHWQRQYLHPALLAFDAPSREECTAKRARSNTPLQSLVLLNDPSFVEAARVFAQRVMREGGVATRDRLQWAFRQALARPAEEQELAILEGLYISHLEQYQGDVEAARKLIGVGESPVDETLPVAELAAWTSVTRTLLNLHETITRI